MCDIADRYLKYIVVSFTGNKTDEQINTLIVTIKKISYFAILKTDKSSLYRFKLATDAIWSNLLSIYRVVFRYHIAAIIITLTNTALVIGSRSKNKAERVGRATIGARDFKCNII